MHLAPLPLLSSPLPVLTFFLQVEEKVNGERVSNNKVCEGFTRGTGGGEEEKKFFAD